MERADEARKARSAGSRNEMFWRIIWPVVVVIIFGGAMLFANGCGGGGGGSDGTKAENSDLNQNNNQNPPTDQNANPPTDNNTPPSPDDANTSPPPNNSDTTSPPDIKTAGTIQLPKTGQTKCYDSSGIEIDCKGTGQDGEIQAGVAWPDTRFIDNNDGTVTDDFTGLMWLKDANTKAKTSVNYCSYCPPAGAENWDSTLAYVAKMNSEKYLGYADWRLPTVNELETLLDLGRWNYALPAGHPFVNLRPARYWSSTVTNAGLNSWYVGFYFGEVGAIYNKEYSNVGYIWPIRRAGDGLIKIAQVGNNEDVATDVGEPWPNPRFIDNNNGTITDALTGLVWVKDMNIAKMSATWQEALNYVAGMNTGKYPNLGYTDWRLPNRKELQSLHYRDRYSYFISGVPSFFTNDTYKPYWSSTTIADSPEKAWAIKYVMYSAKDPLELQRHDKGTTLHFLPVRD